jgi:hypothetical protein
MVPAAHDMINAILNMPIGSRNMSRSIIPFASLLFAQALPDSFVHCACKGIAGQDYVQGTFVSVDLIFVTDTPLGSSAGKKNRGTLLTPSEVKIPYLCSWDASLRDDGGAVEWLWPTLLMTGYAR